MEFWVGEGENRAMLVIDWYLEGSQTLVWGYRWNGTAKGLDMIMAVAKADPRFTFLTHFTGPMGNTIAGFGYDVDGVGSRCLYYENNTEEPHCPVDGVVTTTAYNYDSWTTADSNDYWRSGWYNGYWSYQVKDSPEDDFSYSGLGASSRELRNGSVDGWGYQDGWESWEGTTPKTPYIAALPPANGVSLDRTALTIEPGNKKNLIATVSPENAINKNVNWRSTDTEIVRVNELGEITANSIGKTQIIVSTEEGGYEDSCLVYVVAPTIHVESIHLDKDTLNLPVGDEYTLTALIQPENADNKDVFWAIYDSEIATIDQNGLIKAISAGVTKAVALTTDGSYSASCEITVETKIEAEIESPTDSTIVVSFPKIEQANCYLIYLYRKENGKQILETIYELDDNGNLLGERGLLRSESSYISASLLKKIVEAGYTIEIEAIKIVNNEEKVIGSYRNSTSDPVSNITILPDLRSVQYRNGKLQLNNLNDYTVYLVCIDGKGLRHFRVTADHFTYNIEISTGIYILTGTNGYDKVSYKFIVR
ncbi:MAG: Ig-like domain-containing protein [Massilibacteroides sp.]|nr:Ig-like domain-containing protein [Massilibacteroides sp.]MDD4659897.1 Ig-like domain-containing protein [Massilibacteroides sp.]